MSNVIREALESPAEVGGETERKNYVEIALEDVGGLLPDDLRDVLLDYYKERIRRSHGLPRMGEEILYLFADMFCIDEGTLRSIAAPWACFYVNCLIIDDQIDVVSDKSLTYPMLAQFLADEGQRRLQKVFKNNAPVWEHIYRYRLQSWHAIASELRGAVGQGRYGAAIRQGQKAAMAKVCATALIYGSYGVVPSRRQVLGLDYLCGAVQLLDDIQDYQEDHLAGRDNLMLARCAEWFNCRTSVSGFEGASECQLLCGILLSGAVRDSWVLAAEMFEKAMSLLGPQEGAQGSMYFHEMGNKCRASADRLEAIRSLNGDVFRYLERAVREGEGQTLNALCSNRVARCWEALVSEFRRGPVAAN